MFTRFLKVIIILLFFSSSSLLHPQIKGTTNNEPPLPRRKKCPELAYRHTEFMSCDEPDRNSSNNNNRARVSFCFLIIAI